ncbi:hypothetical protein CAPTEDRAFT_220217 [Capitella teleta]|uniref:Uncharacterized protein n=1 Tax=Capitella teleta TaxID=283909 RepID=R7UHK9_CAPTE|nr:hypothetical protein CAPTEDRAFT_220217 [Capitella teleta]|eukprot:ELU05695.1 hypothetical protein CAPTEDRAFT_220217 [Capitella teleta]
MKSNSVMHGGSDVQQTQLVVHPNKEAVCHASADRSRAQKKGPECPEREPDLSLYLRICKKCFHVLRERQIHHFQSDPPTNQKAAPANEEFWTSITQINDELRSIQLKVENTMPKYQELIEALEVTKGSSQQVTSTNKSNMQVLAKAQGDLADYFTTLLLMLQRIKKISPSTSSQSAICKNISRSVFNYYQDNRFNFNEQRRKLEATTPVEVLEYIQDIVDMNMINSSYITLKQLAFEVLHYSTKHELNESFLRKLLSAEGVIENDLEQMVKRRKEDWGEHCILVDQLLKDQLSKHRLIRSSQTKGLAGDSYVEIYLLERGERVVREVSMQVKSKCAERSFKSTKEVLKVLLEDIKKLHEEKMKSCTSKDEDWVLL